MASPRDPNDGASAPSRGREGWSRGIAEAVFGVRPGEGARTALCFAYLFLASAVFILGRTARDTLFLSRYSLAALPWMFVLFGVASAAVAVGYGALADRISRRTQVWTALLAGVLSYIAVWVLVRSGAHWIYPVFYIWTEMVANLLIMQFWTLANDLFDPRAAKRLFGAIGSARILGVVLCGLAAGLVVKAIGTAQLILVLAALLSVMGLLSVPLFQGAPAPRPRRPSKGSGAGGTRQVLRTPYVRVLTLLLFLVFVSLTVGDYQFKIVARTVYSEDALARFFSLFYAAAGTAGFLFQLVVTPRLLRRYGVLAGLSVMPLSFGLASAGLFFWGGLPLASIMKFSDNGFQYTVHETVLQVLYVPFSPAMKQRARALLDTAVKPLAYGLGGILLVVLAPRLSVLKLSLVTVPLAAVWIAILPKVRKGYLRALEASLSGLAPSFSVDHEIILDSGSRALLAKALFSTDPALVLNAMERLGGEDTPEVRDAYRRLASAGHPVIREQALLRLAALGDEGGLEAARAALQAEEPRVWAAALHALGRLGREEVNEHAARALGHKERAVRVAAAAALLRDGGIEGAVLGGTHLQNLLASPEVKKRIEAAQILQSLGPSGYKPLRRLLLDDDPSVRKAALKAAAHVADPRLVPLLVEALATEKGRQRAARALAAVGPPAVPALAELLGNPEVPRAAKLAVPRILKAIPCEEAFAALLGAKPPEDGAVRLRAFAALGALRQSLGHPPLPLREVQVRIEAEVRQVYALAASWEAAREPYGTPLLADSVEADLRRGSRRVLRLLELRYPRGDMALVLRRLADPGRRANALEALDTLLEPSLKPLVLPLFDDLPWPQRIQRAGRLAFEPRLPLNFLLDRCRDSNPFVAYAAFCAAARHREGAALHEAGKLLSHGDPLVREGVLLAATAFGGTPAGREMAESLRGDPDPVVAALARRALAPQESAMATTEEKLLFLMSVPIFKKLPGEDLAPLARAAQVVSFREGERIFREGEMGDALYVLMRGEVAIEKGGKRLALLGPKEAFGEMAVLDACERSADALALSECEAIEIDSEAFYDILHEQTEIAEGIIKVLTRRLREADAKLKEARESADPPDAAFN
jgi:ATP/ADP translocase/HEAT repeat protein